MPTTLKAPGGLWQGIQAPDYLKTPKAKAATLLPAGYDWLRSQSFDYDHYRVGTSPMRPGTIAGGFTAETSNMLADWRQNATVAAPPRLTSSILNGKAATPSKIGQVSMDFIDMNASLAQLTGEFLGLDQPMLGAGGEFDPMAFLTSKGIDGINAPSRLADYPAGIPGALLDMIQGVSMPVPKPPDDAKYPFQKDGRYWGWLDGTFTGTPPTDEELRQMAWSVAEETTDAATNQWFVDQLYNQFKIDLGRTSGLTTGNARNDYLAKSALQGGWFDDPSVTGMDARRKLLQGGLGITNFSIGKMAAEYLAGVGTEAAEWMRPITPETEAFWQSLSADQRNAIHATIGPGAMATEMIGGLLLFSGLGAYAAIAKGAAWGTQAGTFYRTYSAALTASKATMAAGIGVATATWGALAYWPEDFDLGPVTGEGVRELAARVDLARPISESAFAGAVNAVGMWSSGTFGAGTAARAAFRGPDLARKGLALAEKQLPALGRIPTGPLGGLPNMRIYEFGFGGTGVTSMLGKLGIEEAGLRLSIQRYTMSSILNDVRSTRFARWAATMVGEKTGTFLDAIEDINMKIALAGEDMARPISGSVGEALAYVNTLAKAAAGKMPLLNDDAIRAWNVVVRNARSIDDRLARGLVSEYGAAFMQRLTGSADNAEAVRAWVVKAMDRLPNTNSAGLPEAGKMSLEKWHQTARAVYHYSFDRWVGRITHAAEGTEEGLRISVVSQRHLFRDEADDLIAALRSADDPFVAMDRAMAKIEVEEWHVASMMRPRARNTGPWAPTPQQLADHIEDIRETLMTRRHLPDPASPTAAEPLNVAHKLMDEEGLWTVGYKPVNEAGDFVAAVQTRAGHAIQTHWVDYPLSNVDNINIGNRAVMLNKLESITRGFRTWRIVEYQKGSLFRAISTRTNFSASQISAFHEGVMQLARKYNLNPQTVGRMPRISPGGNAIRDELDDLAARIFGEGAKDNAGKLIEWNREVGRAYRQGYNLNLSAGLTSHIKASFGHIGEAVTYGSDVMYVMWRFGLSPLFKGGEIWESMQLNIMRRVDPNADPWVTTLYTRAGAGVDPGVIREEVIGDMFAQGFAERPGQIADIRRAAHDPSGRGAAAAERRAASTLSWHARLMPENYAQLAERQTMRVQAKAYRAKALGGEAIYTTNRGRLFAELANSVDDEGRLLAGVDEDSLRQVLRKLNRDDLDPAVRESLERHPWGVPTDKAVQDAANMRAQSEVLRDPNQLLDALDSERMVVYRELIDKGWIEADPQLALKDRLDELRDILKKDRRAALDWRSGRTMNGYGPRRPPGVDDIRDPLTGRPVMRDPANASDREFEFAIRSLASRSGRIHIVPPSAEELALRLDDAAETLLSRRPIMRSDKVGTADALPDGFALDPAELVVEGHPGGVFSQIDTTVPAEERGLYHVTTAHDAVMDTGVKSRKELIRERVPEDLRDTLRQARADGVKATDMRVILKDGGEIVLEEYELDYFLKEVINHGGDYNSGLNISSGISAEKVAIVENTTNKEVIWRAAPAQRGRMTRAPEGLSAGSPNDMVSTTVSYEHAVAIQEGTRVLSDAANGRMDAEAILNHFYDKIEVHTGDEATTVMALADYLDHHTVIHYAPAAGYAGGRRFELAANGDLIVAATGRQVTPMEAFDLLAADMQKTRLTKAGVAGNDGQAAWDMVVNLDLAVRESARHFNPDVLARGEFDGSVIFAGSYEGARDIVPDQIAILQVGARTRRFPPLGRLEASDAMQEAFRIGDPLDASVVVHYTDGSRATFIRWTGSKTYGGKTEAESFREFMGEAFNDIADGKEIVGVTTVGVPNGLAGGVPEDIVTAGHPSGSLSGARPGPHQGPDNFEIQVHSDDLFVIDERITGQPLAADDEGLFRQLRQVEDEEGIPLPGYEKRHGEIVHELDVRRQQALGPDPVDNMADIPETAEGITANMNDLVRERLERAKAKIKDFNEDFWDPVPGKHTRETQQIIQMQREEFPHAIAGTPAEEVFRATGIPETQWADWLVVDRNLLDTWHASGDPADLQKLMDHAGTDATRASMNELYASEEWEVIAGLWSLNLRSASEEAFGTHFFDQYRSPLLRSINHPVLGVYPASWALKTGREWAKFLFDNRMFGTSLRMGRTPATLIGEISNAQAVAFAKENPNYEGTFDDYTREGPLGNMIFVFNLLMPGDWSSIPFPLSRTLREILRNQNATPYTVLESNYNYLGVTRDARLMWNSIEEGKELFFPSEPDPTTGAYRQQRNAPEWSELPHR